MRATLNIPDELMAKVMRLARETSKTGAIVAAMESYIKTKGQEEIRRLRGTIAIAYDWEAEEGAELAAQRERGRRLGARR